MSTTGIFVLPKIFQTSIDANVITILQSFLKHFLAFSLKTVCSLDLRFFSFVISFYFCFFYIRQHLSIATMAIVILCAFYEQFYFRFIYFPLENVAVNVEFHWKSILPNIWNFHPNIIFVPFKSCFTHQQPLCQRELPSFLLPQRMTKAQ